MLNSIALLRIVLVIYVSDELSTRLYVEVLLLLFSLSGKSIGLLKAAPHLIMDVCPELL